MAFAKVFSNNHIQFKFGLLLIVGFLAGCASVDIADAPYVPDAPRWSEVPSAAPLPIDGKWKAESGVINSFEKGKGRMLNASEFDPLAVTFQNIQKVGPGKYTLERLAWNNISRKSNFVTGEMKLISPTEIVLRTYPDPVTQWGGNKTILTNVGLANDLSYLQEIEDAELKFDLSVSKDMPQYSILFLTENEDNTISKKKTNFTDSKNITVNFHNKPCVKKDDWKVSFFLENGSEKSILKSGYDTSSIRTQYEGSGNNCVSKTMIQTSTIRSMPPGDYKAILKVGGTLKYSVDFTISP